MQHAIGWVVAAIVSVLLALVHVAAHDALVREAAWTLLVSGSCAAVLVGLRSHRPPARRPWYVLAAALAALAATNFLQLPVWIPPAWLAPVLLLLELVSFPLIGIATYLMVRRQSPRGDREGAIDGAIVLAALATVLWDTAAVAGGGLDAASALGRSLSVVAPLVLAGVTTAALRLLFVGTRSPSTYLMVGAAAGALVGHILRTYAQSAGTYARGSWEDLFIAAAYACAGLAALHPSMPHLTRPQPTTDGRLTLARLTILGGALLTPPIAMLLKGRATPVPLVASMLVSTLVLVRLWRLVVEREAVRQELRRQAMHDGLTGLPNRTELQRRLREALRRGVSPGMVTAAVFIDLDGFKQVNDDYGHGAGDQALVAVSARLAEACRAEDLLGRLSGDEFVLVCDGVEPDGVEAITDRVLAAFDEPFRLAVADVTLGASVGVSVGSGAAVTAEQLLAEADSAMYEAKQRSGSAVVRYDAELGARLRRRRRLERDLEGAVERGELQLVYQPVMELSADAGAPVAAEALLRWSHPALGLIEASELVPLADATGLIVPVGAWVAEEGCSQLARWGRAGLLPPGFRLLLNVSPRQLLDRALSAHLAEVCARHGLDPSEVVVETTEAALRDASGAALGTLRQLHDAGFGIALDDFGGAWSSLRDLRRLPLHLLKVDASLVHNLGDSADDRAIVAALVGLAHRLGIRLVGEGVESAEQRRQLRSLGCDLGQGHHLGRPVPPELLRLGAAKPAPEAAARPPAAPAT